jgi:serine/threonine-protein kinase RIO1
MNDDESRTYAESTQSDKQDNDKPDRRKRHVPLTVFESVVEKQIQEAFERGDFDNLQGQGEPIRVEKNVYAGDKELAYKLLKDNNFTLPWIADRVEVTEAIEVFRGRMAYQYRLIAPEVRAMVRADQVAVASQRWSALISEWEAELASLNSRIGDVNLLVPVRNLEILLLTLGSELKRLGTSSNVREV